MSWVLRNLSYAFHFRRENSVAEITHPILKLVGLLITIIIAVSANVSNLMILLIIILIEALYIRRIRNIFEISKAMMFPLFFVGFFALILYGITKALELILRLLVIGYAIIIFMTTTLPSELAQVFESIGIPRKIIIIPELALRVIPYIASDTQQAIESLLLRKEIKLSPIPRGISKVFAAVIMSAVKRSNFLAEALLAKHYFQGKGTKFYEFKITVYGIIQLVVKILFLIVIMLSINLTTMLLNVFTLFSIAK